MSGKLRLVLVTRTFTVTCGRCANDSATMSTRHGRPAIERELRKLGWSLTGSHGWVCSDCASTRRKQLDGSVRET